jgi:hypothetical protein
LRTLRLAESVAQAERLRLKAMARRMAMRAAFAAVGGVFLLAALLAVDASLVVLLLHSVALVWACLIVAGGNLVIALVLGLLAMRDVPGSSEREALALRRDAWAAVKRDLAFTTLLSTALNVWRRTRRR